MSTASPRVVVAGGGVAALEAVLALLERAPRVPVQLIAADAFFVNRPLSVLEPFGARPATRLPLSRLGDHGVGVTQGRVTAVDPGRRTVRTGDGTDHGYDALVVALGARAVRPLEHALTFRGSRDAEALHGLVQDVEAGAARRVAFVAPPGSGWLLPLYELALQTAASGRATCLDGLELLVATPEQRPLQAFGRTASSVVECLLEEAGVELITGADVRLPTPHRLVTRAGGPRRPVDRVVSLPRLQGCGTPGLPHDRRGFLEVDAWGRVAGVPRVYAAGDGTARPIKQGGLAAQQADAAVDALLADLGLAPPPPPAAATLRGVLVTGDEVWYLRRGEDDPDGEVSRRPLWWPPSKVAGRHLAPFLAAERGGRDEDLECPPGRSRATVRSAGGRVRARR